nr:MAG TPA: hypothetical protein [Bacteriophage sp.]DAY35003.1 MAG TPA: hypothetical protein [Bacteriophage sp.]
MHCIYATISLIFFASIRVLASTIAIVYAPISICTIGINQYKDAPVLSISTAINHY